MAEVWKKVIMRYRKKNKKERKSEAKEKTGAAAHLVLIAASNILFYLGVFGVLRHGQSLGIYAGLFLVVFGIAFQH